MKSANSSPLGNIFPSEHIKQSLQSQTAAEQIDNSASDIGGFADASNMSLIIGNNINHSAINGPFSAMPR